MAEASIAITFDELPCIDAGMLLPQASAAELITQHVAGRANSFRCPLGPAPGKGWFLLPRVSLQTILGGESFASYFTHTVRFYAGAAIVALAPMIPIRATGVSILKGRDEPEAAWLLEVADRRALLNLSAINKQYNVRRPDGITSRLFYTATLNNNDPWTWVTMLTDIWGQLPSQVAGTFPGLPVTPHGTPENWRFMGISAWQALSLVLEHLSMAVAYNPIADTFSIVQQGPDNTTHATLLSTNDLSRTWDGAQLDYDRTKFPEKVRIYFKKADWNYASSGDSTLPATTDDWQVDPLYSIDKDTGVLAAIPGTFVAIHDDLVAYYDQNGALVNSSELEARATERKDDFLRRRGNDHRSSEVLGFTTDSGIHRTYSGLLDFVPSSQIYGVAWRHYGDGVKTEVIRRAQLIRDVENDWGIGRDRWLAAENVMSPDLGRWGIPYTRFAWARSLTSISANASSTVRIIRRDTNNNWTDTAIDVTAWEIFRATIAASKRLWLAWHQQSGQWHIMQAECP